MLPDKFTDDLLDEHGNKMSKRCGNHTLLKLLLLSDWCGCSKSCFPVWIVCRTNQQLLQERHCCLQK